MLAFAKCMRDQGIDMPDPQFDGGRVMQRGPDERVSPEKMRKADAACSKYREEIEPPELSPEQEQEMKEAALAHAQCMREHGLEKFPDPTFDEERRRPDPHRPGHGPRPRRPGLPGGREGLPRRAPRPRGGLAVKWVAVAAASAAAVVAAVVLLAGGDEAPPVRAAAATATAAVERRDLVDRESVDGTLGYADAARPARGRDRRRHRAAGSRAA